LRYDLDQKTNPYLMERIGSTPLSSRPILHEGKYLLVVRVEVGPKVVFCRR